MQQNGIENPPKRTIMDALIGILGLDPVQGANTTQVWRDWEAWFKRLTAAVPKVQTFSTTINPGSCAANTTTAQTFALAGLTTEDIVLVNKPSHTAGLVLGAAFVPSDNNITIIFGNLTGAPIDPPSEAYRVVAIRR